MLAALALVGCDAATGTPSTAALPVALAPIVDVPTYKADALRTGVHPGPGIPTEPVQVWSRDLGCSIGRRPVVISGGTLVVGCDKPILIALDARTGALLWSRDLEAPVRGAVAIEDGQVLVSTPVNMEARSLVDGSQTWTKPVPGAENPTVADGVFFGGTRDGDLVGFRVADASDAFHYDAGAPDDSMAVLAADGTAADGTVFVSTAGGWFRAIDWASGTELWKRQVRSGSVSSPAITPDVAYVAGLTVVLEPPGELYAIDRTDGSLLWSAESESGGQIGPPIVRGATVYAGSLHDGVYAFDARTGDARWGAPAGHMQLPVATAGDVVFAVGINGATGRDSVYAVRATDGRALWTIDLDSAGSSPVVSGGMLFVTDDAGHVRAYAEPSAAALIAPLVAAVSSAAPPSATPEPLPPLFGEATMLDSVALGLDHPTGMDVGPDGNVYIVNAGRSEILVLSPEGELVRRWNGDDTADGPLEFQRDPGDVDSVASGVGVAPDGTVYVTDTVNDRVRIFTPDGEAAGTFGRYGDDDGQFIDPIDVDVASDGTVFVVDDMRDDIQRFDPDGTYIETIGRQGSGPRELLDTGGIHVDAQDRLYNADWGNSRIQAWGPDGTFLWRFGHRGTGPGEFMTPGDVATDRTGRVFVVDRGRVQEVADGDRAIGAWKAPVLELTSLQVVGDEIWIDTAFDSIIWRLPLDP